MECCLFFSLFLFFVTQDIRMNARKERILPPDEIEDLHDDDSDFLKSFEIKSKINIFFPQIHLILTVNNKNIIKTKKKTNNSIKTIISVMTAKRKKEKKVMEEKRPSLPEVVTVRKRPRTPGVTLNRLKDSICRIFAVFLSENSYFSVSSRGSYLDQEGH